LKNIRGGGPPGTTNTGSDCVNTASCNNTNMSKCENQNDCSETTNFYMCTNYQCL
jgi:hypothetical protein